MEVCGGLLRCRPECGCVISLAHWYCTNQNLSLLDFLDEIGITRKRGAILQIAGPPDAEPSRAGVWAQRWHVTVPTAILSVIVLLWVCIAVYCKRLEHKMMVAITASVVVSYYVHLSDLALLLAALVFMMDYCAGTDASPHRKVTNAACVILLVAPTCNWFTFAARCFYLVSLPVFFLLFVLATAERSTEAASQVTIRAQ